MSERLDLNETPFNQEYQEHMRITYVYSVQPNVGTKLVSGLLIAIAQFMKIDEKKNVEPVTLGIYDYDNPSKFIIGFKLTYDANTENPSNPGAYEFTVTTDEALIANPKYTFTNSVLQQRLSCVLVEKLRLSILNVTERMIVVQEAVKSLNKFIENQAIGDPTKIHSYEIPSILCIDAGYEDGEFFMKMLPGDVLKTEIKDDVSASAAQS